MEKDRCVVRLRRTAWSDGKAVHYKESLVFLKTKCSGYNILEEDVSNAGAMDAYPINTAELEDGIYEVVWCNVSHDYESGHVDGWNLKLIPYIEDAAIEEDAGPIQLAI